MLAMDMGGGDCHPTPTDEFRGVTGAVRRMPAVPKRVIQILPQPDGALNVVLNHGDAFRPGIHGMAYRLKEIPPCSQPGRIQNRLTIPHVALRLCERHGMIPACPGETLGCRGQQRAVGTWCGGDTDEPIRHFENHLFYRLSA